MYKSKLLHKDKKKETKHIKIALVGPTDRSIWTFRKGLIEKLVSMNHDVFVICEGKEYVDNIISLGAKHINLEMSRFLSINSDFKYFTALLKIFRKEKFDLIHTFTIKPNFFGSIAARLSGTKNVYSLVEGLGFLYSEDKNFVGCVAKLILFSIYKITFLLDTRVWLINQDDLRDLTCRKILPEKKIIFTKSIGVDLEVYCWDRVDANRLDSLKKEIEIKKFDFCITLIARMNYKKGISFFIEAAQLLELTHPNAVFLLVGEIQEGSPYTITEKYLKQKQTSTLKWLGFRRDILEIIAISDIIVLPTFYREGVPRTLLEGMALGKPLVTTDYVGCREVVEHGKNGFMVPIKNGKALADAIGILIENPKMRKSFGNYSLELIKNELNESIIVEKVIRDLYRL